MIMEILLDLGSGQAWLDWKDNVKNSRLDQPQYSYNSLELWLSQNMLILENSPIF